MKTCTKCGVDQDDLQFSRLKKGEEKRSNTCNTCTNARLRERYIKRGPHRTGWVEEGVGYIPLTKGQVAKVDSDDVKLLSQWNWLAAWSENTQSYYAQRQDYSTKPSKTVRMHRFLLAITDPKIEVDHENHDTLDNRKSNIRPATRKDNTRNRKIRGDSKQGLKGIGTERTTGKYTASIYVDGERVHLGTFDTKEEAHACYTNKAEQIYGEFAYREDKRNAL